MKAKKRKAKKVTATPKENELQAKPVSQPAAAAENGKPITDNIWFALCGAVIAVAAFLRFFRLELKPMHHDEGVNGFFLKTLISDGVYKYDPANYHGPTLYYISLVFAKLFGFETIPLRVSMAIFGLLMVVFVLFLRRYIGTAGSLIAGLLLAVSPGMVYISRYFIHEILFVFLSMAIVLSVLFFIEKRKAGPFAIGWTALLLLVCFAPSTIKLSALLGGENTTALWAFRIGFFIVEIVLTYLVLRLLQSWDNGRPIYLLLASASAALFFATKETAFITLGTMLIACVSVWIWRRLGPDGFSRRNWFRVIIAAHFVVLAAALYYRQNLADGYKWLFDISFGNNRPQGAFVFFSIIFMAVAATAAWVIFLIDYRRSNESEIVEPVALTWGGFRQGLGNRTNILLIALGVVVAFSYTIVLFFTSFFTYAEGVQKAFEAYAIWTRTGNKDHTMHGYLGYLKWGTIIESAIIILSVLGALIAMVKAKHRFAMFTALWAFGLFAAYSIVPYKTPWLALSFFLPMCIIAGYGINELLAARNIRLKSIAVALTLSATALLTYQMYQLNVVRYDDDAMPYVYAHTRRQFLEMVREIERHAEKSGKGKDAQIEIVTPDYWPMTWYVKDYTKAYFQGKLVDASTAEIIVAKKKDQDAGVIQKYSNHYKFVGVYALRPGVDLVLLVRNDLADANAKELSEIPRAPNTP